MSTDAVTELGLAPSLPRVPAGALAALHRLYEDAPEFALAAGALQGRLRFVFDQHPAHGIGAWARQRFRLGAHTGTLGIDGMGVAALTGEPRFDLLPPELRTIALADALHALVEAVQSALRLRFEWLAGDAPPSVEALEAASVAFECRGDGAALLARGFVAFDDLRAFDAVVPAFERRGPRAALPGLQRLVLPLRFEVGRTTLRWQELRGVGRGDIVGIERWRAAGAGLQLEARLGALQLHAVAEGARLTLQSIGEMMMNTASPPANAGHGDDGQLPLERLDALEVDLRFELGALQLSLGELRALKPGHVFDLAEPLNRSTVRIVAHGNVLGKGHLVAVGDRLGVRVAEFATGAL